MRRLRSGRCLALWRVLCPLGIPRHPVALLRPRQLFRLSWHGHRQPSDLGRRRILLFTLRVYSGRITRKETTLLGETAIEATTLARRAVELAEDKQASDIVMLDLRKLNIFTDYFVICSGESDRQLKAIIEAIDEGVSREMERDARVEGTPDTGWVLLDYGDVVVHVFSVAVRDYYRLERLWSKATPVVVVQ